MAWISIVSLHRRKKNLVKARVPMLLKSRASLTCFRACFLPGRAEDLSASRYNYNVLRPRPLKGYRLLHVPPGLTFGSSACWLLGICVFVWISEQTVTSASYIINRLVFITEVETVYSAVDCVWNVMAHAQKPDFVFRRNWRIRLNRPGGRQFSWLLAAEVCASAVVMLDTPCSEVLWRVLATHCIRQFPLHFPSRASPCAITFQLESSRHLLLTFHRVIYPSDVFFFLL